MLIVPLDLVSYRKVYGSTILTEYFDVTDTPTMLLLARIRTTFALCGLNLLRIQLTLQGYRSMAGGHFAITLTFLAGETSTYVVTYRSSEVGPKGWRCQEAPEISISSEQLLPRGVSCACITV